MIDIGNHNSGKSRSFGKAAQEEFVAVLERIAETGESVLVGWNKCFLEERHE